MAIKKKLGFAEIAAFAGVNDNGEAVVQGPTVTVNHKMTAPNLKHQSRIFGKKYEVTEIEDQDAFVEGNRMVAYQKNISGVQKDMDGSFSGQVNEPSEYRQENQEQEKPQDGLTVSKVLKNMIDNLENKTTAMWIVIAIIAIISAMALGFALS